MLEGSWCLYEERLPRKRIFHRKKRSWTAPLFSIAAVMGVIGVVVSHL